MGLFHEVRGWLQLHHHFRPWAHVISVRALLTRISSNRPQGAIYHTQDNQMQHFSARTLTPLQNASPTPACFFLPRLKGTVQELATSALHPVGSSLTSREPLARNMHSASTPGYCFLQAFPSLPIHFKLELAFIEILYGILPAPQSHKMLSFYKLLFFIKNPHVQVT